MKKILIAIALVLSLPIIAYADENFIQAARDGNRAFVQSYIQSGGDVDAKNPHGGTAIMFAARAGHVEIAQLLIDAGADLNVHGNYAGTTALIWAAQYGPAEIVRLFIQGKAEINAKNHDGNTALDFAKERGHAEIVDILQSAGGI